MITIDEAARDGMIFIMSIDTTTCPVDEPRPWSKKNSSHKLGGDAGVNYELGIQISESKLAWRRGPIPAGEYNDIEIFRGELKGKIPTGRKLIGDSGYKGEEEYISTENDLDPNEVDYFKNRVLSRHESFNCRLKKFKILEHRFRHGIENHHVAFDAVCTVVLYNMENGDKSLFNPYP
jgi:hypothetical protein